MTTKTHKSQISRNHHFVPQCYLRGFTHTRNRQSRLFVVDAIEKKHFAAVARNVGAERDFNRIDIEGIEPDALEKSFGQFEGLLAPALQRIDANQTLNCEDDKIILLNLIALLGIRNPRWRSRMNNFQEHIFKQILDISLSSKERWESIRRNMEKDGVCDPEIEVSYEQLKKFKDEEAYTIHIPRERNITLELDTFNTILECLINRVWTVVPAATDTGFITSDHPVCLQWSETDNSPSLYRPPGFGLKGTDVIFPVSNKILVLGRFEDNLEKLESGEYITAYFNSVITSFAERQIYSADANFLYLDMKHNLSMGDSILHQPFFERPINSD